MLIVFFFFTDILKKCSEGELLDKDGQSAKFSRKGSIINLMFLTSRTS